MEHSSQPGLNYLTVQDILWINLQLLKTARPFGYAALEEAVNAQYAYGASKDVPAQAAKLAMAFTRLAPFDAGNDPTGFVATLSFLALNGKIVSLPDSEGANWHEKLRSGAVLPERAIELAIDGDDPVHRPASVEDAVRRVLADYSGTLATMVGAQPVAV